MLSGMIVLLLIVKLLFPSVSLVKLVLRLIGGAIRLVICLLLLGWVLHGFKILP